MARPEPMDRAAAARIARAAQNQPRSCTARTGFDDRARRAAARNEPLDPYDYDSPTDNRLEDR